MVGNARADAAADVATSCHGAEVVRLAGWLHDRYSAYLGFMRLVSKHLVEAYLFHRALTDNEHNDEAATKIDKAIFYKLLAYASDSDTKRIVACPGISNFATFNINAFNVAQVQSVLANIEVALADGHAERAITWHELYVMYRPRGYSKVTPDPGRLAVSRPNPDKLLRDFKNLTRNLVRGVLAGSADLDSFQACQNLRTPCQGRWYPWTSCCTIFQRGGRA